MLAVEAHKYSQAPGIVDLLVLGRKDKPLAIHATKFMPQNIISNRIVLLKPVFQYHQSLCG